VENTAQSECDTVTSHSWRGGLRDSAISTLRILWKSTDYTITKSVSISFCMWFIH